LDYAKMLVDIGKYEKAMPYLQNFLVYYQGNTEVQLALAKMDFWKGKYKKAENNASELMTADPANTEAASLRDEILMAKSPWIGMTGSYYTDNQPLQTISPVLESSIWLHPLSTLRFSVRSPFFSQGGTYTNALWVQAGNSAFIWKGNWKITTDVGVLKYPYKNTTTWTGNLELEKRSFRYLIISAQAERKPYFYTVSSIDTVINENHLAAAISWDNFNSWNGQASFNLDYFLADKNAVYAFSIWGFAPPLKASVFDFRLGYGFSYSTADENHFEPVGKKADIIANYDSTIGIKGIYYPYFTPDRQSIHSVLVAIGIHPVKGFDIGASGNLGFFATAKIPYFYLDTNGAGGYVIKKDFSKKRYFPFTVSAFASVQLSKKISLRADYRYNSTYFYTEHYVGLQLKIHLWNAKKRK
ncbi:MAG: tetratricopeptide repeat protein, partial [Bacteroidota bacterium]